ncbi:MAG: Ribosomal small subunit Rsm22 [Verrucomicrobia bacterium]|jgi:SAM-dependent methyltransferase|nr:Ribosomal small subunit Rsm22 [Verrucomicrobiota bacterium]
MNWQTIDWHALDRLRQSYLTGSAGGADYWRSHSDLDSYNQTFAQRIGWKWDYVLEELQSLGWTPPVSEVLDWGCGSGVAGRAFLDHYGTESVTGLRVWDRSRLAMDFAVKTARKKYAALNVQSGLTETPGILLLSHVLTELKPEQIDELANYVAKAEVVIWVEPGTYEASLTLIAVRERLRTQFSRVAPCPHAEQCGILAPGNERDWCHHFASPPSAIFTDPDWGKFAHMMGIDLRSLPLSYLVLDKRPRPALPPDTYRVIGRPRIYKAYALIQGCNACGVKNYQLSKRDFPAEFKLAKKDKSPSLQRWETEEDQITAIHSESPDEAGEE